MAEQQPDVTIEATPLPQRHLALLLLRLGHARIGRLLEAAEEGQIDMLGLFHARRGERFVGAAWGQIVPGRTAFCWPACLVAGEPEETAIQLQSAVDRHLDNAGVIMAQAILPMRDVVNSLRLTRAGYRHLADLNYLVSPRDRFPIESPPSTLQFEPSTGGDLTRWRELLDRTYQGSLDCSDVDGVRRIDDVLNSYRRTGEYRPEWWIFVRYQGQDVGCALLADHPAHNQAEFMYIGIVPEMRGRGWGLEVTRYAQWIAWGAGRDRLVLAVDDGNWPAQNIYEKTGFDIWDQRSVYIRAAVSAAGVAETNER